MERRTAENIEQEDIKIFIGQKDSIISDSRTADNCTGGQLNIGKDGGIIWARRTVAYWTVGQLIQEDIRLLDRKPEVGQEDSL